MSGMILTYFLPYMVVREGAADQDGHDCREQESSVHAGQWSTHIDGGQYCFYTGNLRNCVCSGVAMRPLWVNGAHLFIVLFNDVYQPCGD
jgi:hypothetical protein